jgi:indolepyruvate ferredoxin oxidoreductase beta subunit
MDKTISVLLVGVGGQGIVLASDVLCAAAMHAGYDVKKSEIHGMAQRGGSVVSHVRFGKKVFSPVIPLASADYIVSFERMEFMRYMDHANENSVLVLNSRHILPPSVSMGTEVYPDAVINEEMKKFKDAVEINADELAEQAGNIKAAGTVMLGALAKYLDIDKSAWEKAITEMVPGKALNVNLSAFRI